MVGSYDRVAAPPYPRHRRGCHGGRCGRGRGSRHPAPREPGHRPAAAAGRRGHDPGGHRRRRGQQLPAVPGAYGAARGRRDPRRPARGPLVRPRHRVRRRRGRPQRHTQHAAGYRRAGPGGRALRPGLRRAGQPGPAGGRRAPVRPGRGDRRRLGGRPGPAGRRGGPADRRGADDGAVHAHRTGPGRAALVRAGRRAGTPSGLAHLRRGDGAHPLRRAPAESSGRAPGPGRPAPSPSAQPPRNCG